MHQLGRLLARLLTISLFETVDVEVGEVRGRLVQVVVEGTGKPTPDLLVTHLVSQLLIELLVRDHLLG